jgi:prevent-host-death family protein
MELRVSLREANQHLSRYVKAVEDGDIVVITRRGKPVARLISEPAVRELNRDQVEARERTRNRLKKGYPLAIERFDRESIYER